MMKTIGQSIPKFGVKGMNEDAIRCGNGWVAVSDGAGGGGVYADRWSRYLVNHLPADPIATAEELDAWIDGIWETFYQMYEEKARRQGGLLLDKFYQEGAFATLTAVWRKSPAACEWMSYGDSVAFCYNLRNGSLQHSFTSLADFQQPPYLINCKDPLSLEGFRHGSFRTTPDSVVFVASDALAQYILQQYAVCNREFYSKEIQEVLNAHNKASNHLQQLLTQPVGNFGKQVICPLQRQAISVRRFKQYVYRLYQRGCLSLDDYSIAFLSN